MTSEADRQRERSQEAQADKQPRRPRFLTTAPPARNDGSYQFPQLERPPSPADKGQPPRPLVVSPLNERRPTPPPPSPPAPPSATLPAPAPAVAPPAPPAPEKAYLPEPPPGLPAPAVMHAQSLYAQAAHGGPGPHPPPPAAANPPVPAPAPVAEGAQLQRERERLAQAIETLRVQGERFAEQARADALEIAFQIAQRIVEGELRTSPEPLFSLVRSALKQVGDSRRVVVRVNPSDAELLRGEKVDEMTAGLSVARIEVVSDPSLSRGDCVVDTDFGHVDGRLATRFQELRRAVNAASSGGVA
jgi:flagellar assembly protein FliH